MKKKPVPVPVAEREGQLHCWIALALKQRLEHRAAKDQETLKTTVTKALTAYLTKKRSDA